MTLGQRWNLFSGTDSLLGKVDPNNPNSDVFLDARLTSVANMKLIGDLGWSAQDAGSNLSVKDVIGKHDPMFGSPYTVFALVSESQGGSIAGNRIVLGSDFFGLTNNQQAMILLHEVLHTYTGLKDQDLAAKLGLGTFTNTLNASSAITTWFDQRCSSGVI